MLQKRKQLLRNASKVFHPVGVEGERESERERERERERE